jgi:hypothetical protein
LQPALQAAVWLSHQVQLQAFKLVVVLSARLPIQYRLDLLSRAVQYQNLALTVCCPNLQDVNESISTVGIGLHGFPVIVAHLVQQLGDAVLQGADVSLPAST